jgi:hypothetical protein
VVLVLAPQNSKRTSAKVAVVVEEAPSSCGGEGFSKAISGQQERRQEEISNAVRTTSVRKYQYSASDFSKPIISTVRQEFSRKQAMQ